MDFIMAIMSFQSSFGSVDAEWQLKSWLEMEGMLNQQLVSRNLFWRFRKCLNKKDIILELTASLQSLL